MYIVLSGDQSLKQDSVYVDPPSRLVNEKFVKLCLTFVLDPYEGVGTLHGRDQSIDLGPFPTKIERLLMEVDQHQERAGELNLHSSSLQRSL